MKHRFDVVVVGGGHAGCEAAHAAARMGARVALVTHRFDRVGEMSCNPAIGGVGKGHLVREIDALDGLMGRAADAAGLQFRLLNRRKGPAVRGPRAQCDRKLYRAAIQAAIRRAPRITVVEDEVVDLAMHGHRVRGVVLRQGIAVTCGAVVLTTGTFLGGMIHLGAESWPAGRAGDAASERLAARLRERGLRTSRLKTGTPPRLERKTIDFNVFALQAGDDPAVGLSLLRAPLPSNRAACHVAWTNERTHGIIRRDLSRASSRSGAIQGPGPRYCPSVEDKVTRFADKPAHQVFLEPEGDGTTVYPSGLSTSLPAETQLEFLRSIRGLEHVAIKRPGYAIEYDYLDPRGLDHRLEVTETPGLFLAGQVNGTTGYEEAGAQGVIAGANAAALVLRGEALRVDRAEGYIGVLIDDLVTRGVSEPYRMFTSRAEYRLFLRADNADQRLTPLGIAHGLVGDQRRQAFEGKMEVLAACRSAGEGCASGPLGQSAADLSHVNDEPEELAEAPDRPAVPDWARELLEAETLYAPYVERQAREVARMRRDEEQPIAPDLVYAAMPGLSHELRDKLQRVRPRTIGQASRMEGMTPAALSLILAYSKRPALEAAGDG